MLDFAYMDHTPTSQKKALYVAALIALIFGAYLLRGYISLFIITSVLLSFITSPSLAVLYVATMLIYPGIYLYNTLDTIGEPRRALQHIMQRHFQLFASNYYRNCSYS